ncbi:acriflavin resistance protein [Niastella yeongjuensis]|uniref:Acriflavin resistance protein n=1 Tax=Niastella yeongjuensis TaxID=354355 RepID=A0A1V9E3N1_9BACT|nr:efflux RND transporter permease subunit [Niastella yeongjuensis]OQP40730.1 acriflavin resistance protein [Niastella yeongjuensis]SEP03403.1 Multidrug efflux pump subunit AcrB [Niastella yeongjuensis]
MKLILFALRKPITIMVLVASVLFFGISASRTIKVDIFPGLDLPVLYVAHPYGGFTPNQMEPFFTKQYINTLLFVNGVKSVETKNIQGLTLIKLTFYPGTNMAAAEAEATAATNRAQALFPAGSNPPFLLRFDASTLPIGQLVVSSDTRNNNELLDLANIYVRSAFTQIPGLLSPLPFGGNFRTVVIKPDPELLRSHNLTPEQVIQAIAANNQSTPSGNVRMDDKNYLIPINTTIHRVQDFGNIPLFKGGVENLYLRDIATIQDGADITVGYALVNGKRSVYMPIAKNADASTWEVVKKLKEALPGMQATLPEDVKLTYAFDQSVYVINAVKSLISEGVIGAVLTGLMVLLFLGDWRGAVIVILTIPTSIITGVLFLNLFGQTINIMTLSGLALAIGILVDGSTVTIENIHQHLAMGKPRRLAIWDACKEIAFPNLLILLCILAVFAPAFTMGGIPGSLFLPLALAIGFSVIMSFFLAQTFVPVMANWIMKGHAKQTDQHQPLKAGKFDRLRLRFLRFMDRMMPYRRTIVIVYLIGSIVVAGGLLSIIGKDILPKVNGKQFQVRIRAAEGTRIERTEEKTLKTTQIIKNIVGEENVLITSAYVGLHPNMFSMNPIYLWMAGPHESVLQVAFKEDYKTNLDQLKEKIRAQVTKQMPGLRLSFEPIELTDKILSQGSPTPIEVRFAGRNKKLNEQYAEKLMYELKKISYIRDVQLGQSNKYPAIEIEVDRIRAAQLGVDINDISRSLVASTSSSRYTDRNIWIDERSGNSYNVQVQVPENQMKSLSDIGEIPLLKNNFRPVLSDVATIKHSITYGENDNLGTLPMLTVTANLDNKDLGAAAADVQKAIRALGELPRGLTVQQIGLNQTLKDTLSSLQNGLAVAIVVIFLMLAANFQSFRVSAIILSTVPAVIIGSLALLLITGSTLNLQSYMGIIMSVGVSISNAVLLITNAEQLRLKNGNALLSANESAALRLRPILMTALAMVMGMLPMASGLGEAGDQTSPLGRAVVGGLIASTFAVLFILPLLFAWGQQKASLKSVSLEANDEESQSYINSLSE